MRQGAGEKMCSGKQRSGKETKTKLKQTHKKWYESDKHQGSK